MQSFSSRMLASASCAVIATFVLAGTASAQGTEPPATGGEAQDCTSLATQAEQDACTKAEGLVSEQSDAASANQTIVVTGSRLRRSAFSNSPDPLTVIDPELSRGQGSVETAEVLQSSPVAAGSTQITSFLSSNFVFNGGAGVQTLSLRGLGAERTLVLVDGRRAGPAGVRGAVAAFDLNVLPTSIVRSVEVVKTGASSVYGSDAIAGVVNLLTRRETDGLELQLFGSIPQKSGGETYQATATWGKDFGRGHILLTADYFRRNELERRDRDFLGCSIDNSYDATGARSDVLDPRTGESYCAGDSFGNAISISNFSAALGSGTNLQAPPGAPAGITSIGIIQFNDPGTQTDVYGFPLRPAANANQFVAPAGYFGVNWDRNSTGILHVYDTELAQSQSIIPKTVRYTLFGSGSYEITDGVELFADLLYNRRETKVDGVRQFFPEQFTGSGPLPAFFCLPTTTFGSPNPYCRTTDAGDPFNVGFSGAQLLTPVIIAPFNTHQEIDYYRGVFGARGEIGLLSQSPWRWDIWAQYSRSDGDYTSDIIFADSVDALNRRTRSCVGLNTEIRGVPCIDVDLTDPRTLAGNFTDAERAFLYGTDTGNTRYQQWTTEATLSGELVELWAGPLQGSVGVHIRRDSINDVPGEATRRGNSWQSTRADPTVGHTWTTEAFGEFSLPLFRDRPIGSAELTGAARITNYKAIRNDGVSDTDNGNWTYKIGANWGVSSWLRLRGTYGTSYRAPALFEQFLGNETGFLAQTTIDSCINWATALANGSITQTIADNCAAQGVPNNYTGGGTSSAVVARTGGIGSATGLDPETSRALTASVIFTPPPIWEGMRFSFAVDYFSIKVKDEITGLGGPAIVRGCLDSEFFPTDPLCTLFTRVNNPADPRDNQIIEARNPFINVDTQLNRGFDFTARLSQDMGSWGNLTVLGQATYQAEDAFVLFTGTPANNNGEAGDPKWVGQLDLTWTKKPFTVFYNLGYVGATSDRWDVRRTLGADLCGTNALRGTVCPDFRLDRTFYHAASVKVDLMDRFEITAGVRNIFDTPPPVTTRSGLGSQSGGNIGNGVPLAGSQYDYFGRRFFMNLKAKF